MRCSTRSSELPPRTRRIRTHGTQYRRPLGTTSAHAENTFRDVLVASRKRNYLRARGEYLSQEALKHYNLELPPRTRRIPLGEPTAAEQAGTTSAHAENTVWTGTPNHKSRNYLRARGEYGADFKPSRLTWELPPRTRRIPGDRFGLGDSRGTTSAHAENTLNQLGLL